jgi:hypothetical protein
MTYERCENGIGMMEEQTRARTISALTSNLKPASISCGANHDVVLPEHPARYPRPHHRPPTRRTDDAQNVLCHLQIVDSSHAKTPLPSHRLLRPEIPRRAVEEDISGCFHLSRSPHTKSLPSWHSVRHHHGYGCGWLDSHLSEPRTFALGVLWPGGSRSLPRPFPWNIAHPQITPSDLRLPGGFRSYLFFSSSRGSRVGFYRQQGRCLEYSFDLTQIHRDPRDNSFRRVPPYRTSIVGPPGWSPLRKDQGGVLCRRCRVNDGFGVGVFWHPQIPLRFLFRPRCVSFNFREWSIPYHYLWM